ncbi:MAG: V-type ATP synthase subunit A [Lewinellaceae bacterium]|nr:V-type ATP synthase subunit A [Phaeodactylibacter sp.]MCB9035687.1 V-type ATP synthase subunit A [Lewinellaceae bacterium]
MKDTAHHTRGKVSGIIANLVIVQVDGPVAQNEICFIQHAGTPLMAEVIKILGDKAYVQVFESTRGLQPGMKVDFAGHLLEATLGPGILSKNYDGLMHDLDTMTGVFLKRGEYTDSFDMEKTWDFRPLAKVGDKVSAGSWLGEVTENSIPHKIMAPFKLEGQYTLRHLAEAGAYPVTETIARLADNRGNEIPVSMVQKWPVKKAVKAYQHKPRPFKLLETGVRTIDTLNPIVEGGTGFIPGPFGSGKTVMQQAISRQAEANIVVVAACGERANEVVDLFTEFPELDDPWTGRKLMERTTIIANTSNMPVAAREASVYTAMTIAEYYRAMGLKVLLLADSTSRWAQALREMSNRMEELPGPDAFPMDLPAIISNFYSRAGIVYLNNGQTGSITFIGTVSPAGGNLKEPVTESTKKVARCFYALSQQRADSKRYPAIDPIDSYSKYLEYPELQKTLKEQISPDWIDKVEELKNILFRGKEAAEQINILGDDGVSVETHLIFWRSETVDAIILQQDAFDPVDSRSPLARQKYMADKILAVTSTELAFESYEEVNPYFKRVIAALKQMNYSEFESEKFKQYEEELQQILEERKTG